MKCQVFLAVWLSGKIVRKKCDMYLRVILPPLVIVGHYLGMF